MTCEFPQIKNIIVDTVNINTVKMYAQTFICMFNLLIRCFRTKFRSILYVKLITIDEENVQHLKYVNCR